MKYRYFEIYNVLKEYGVDTDIILKFFVNYEQFDKEFIDSLISSRTKEGFEKKFIKVKKNFS